MLKKILLLLLIAISCFGISGGVDSTMQRRDGSQLVDIWFNIGDIRDCVDIILTPITMRGETLSCETFIEPSDTGTLCSDGDYHIVWNFGIDEPNREFFTDSIQIIMIVVKSGIVPGECPLQPLVAGAGHHSNALHTNGTVWSWGSGTSGRLGDGTTIERNEPVQVILDDGSGFLEDIIYMDVGGHGHSLAIRSDGTVWAWGWNESGQLGDGTTTNRHGAVQVVGPDGTGYLTDIIAVTGGSYHSLALRADGTVWAWGRNNHGCLGDGTLDRRYTPVQVLGEDGVGFLTDIIAISSGSSLMGAHNLALKSDGTVWAWGNNGMGRLGDGTTTERHTPVQVVGPGGVGFLENIIRISCSGSSHNLAIRSDGTLWSWGGNNYGQLGDGTTVARHRPVQVVGPGGAGFFTQVVDIEVSQTHCLAVRRDGSLWAWGYNNWGRLGDGTTTDRHTPTRVLGPDGVGYMDEVISISSGAAHSLALREDGSVWAWGWNNYGQLGDGTDIDRDSPVQVHGGDTGLPFLNLWD